MPLNESDIQRAGFFRRLLAFMLDALITGFLSTLIAILLFGVEYFSQLNQISPAIEFDWRQILLEQGFPALWTIGFWCMWQATPGKMLMDVEIVSAKTLQRPGPGQLVIRYLGYIVSSLPLGLGFLWILFDKRKQGWHDKLAGTRVIMQDAALTPIEAYHA